MNKNVKVEPFIADDESDIVEHESREDRFLRIAAKRVNRILGDLTLIELMAGSGNYKFDRTSIEAMVSTLHGGVDRLEQRYELVLTRKNAATARHSFSFDKGAK